MRNIPKPPPGIELISYAAPMTTRWSPQQKAMSLDVTFNPLLTLNKHATNTRHGQVIVKHKETLTRWSIEDWQTVKRAQNVSKSQVAGAKLSQLLFGSCRRYIPIKQIVPLTTSTTSSNFISIQQISNRKTCSVPNCSATFAQKRNFTSNPSLIKS